MKNNFKFIAVAAVSLAIGFTLNNFAMSNIPTNFKVAVVDVPQIVKDSKQLQQLKEEQKQKIQELAKYVQTAKTNISSEKDATKKKSLEEKYTKELATKKSNIEKDYAKKLKVIDKNISDAIEAQAKAGNYNLVLTKGVVLSGGEDITKAVSAAVK